MEERLQYDAVNLIFFLCGSSPSTCTGYSRWSNRGVGPRCQYSDQGGTQGTITDLDGKFSLNAPNKKSILIVSFIGYVTQELPVETAKPMSIILKEDTKTLDEVVIVGYQEVKKKDLTGAVAKVNMEDLLKTPASSFDQTLGGRIAGVNVSSGEGYAGRNDEYRYPW